MQLLCEDATGGSCLLAGPSMVSGIGRRVGFPARMTATGWARRGHQRFTDRLRRCRPAPGLAVLTSHGPARGTGSCTAAIPRTCHRGDRGRRPDGRPVARPGTRLCRLLPGLAIVCDSGLGRDRPSGLPQHILGAPPYRWIYLSAMISFFDCAAVAVWHDGRLRRSLSVTVNGQLAGPPVTGEIVENIGDPLPFEQSLWARHSPHGEHRIPFHPLDLGEAALAAILGLPLCPGRA